jgi:large subunit ribosomal protein L24
VKVRKGDRVQVLQGKDRGKQGTVMKAIPTQNRVIVEGVNIAKRHQRATRATMQGGIIDKDMPISASAVAVVCPRCGPTRVAARMDDEGHRVRDDKGGAGRICRKCGGDL